MGEIPLLVTDVAVVPEAGQVGACLLKLVVRLIIPRVVEIVVGAEVLAIVDLVIEAHGKLVFVVGSGGHRLIRRDAGGGGIRAGDVILQQADGHRILAGARNDAAVKDRSPRRTGDRGRASEGMDRAGASAAAVQDVGHKLIADAAAQPHRGEISARLRRTGDEHHVSRGALPDASRLVRNKEKGPVFFDRAAERAAELVLIPLRSGGVEIALRVEHGVAEILVQIAMELIRAGLGNDVDHGTRVSAVLGVKRIGDDAEFLDAVRRGLNRRQVDELVVGVAAVHAEIVGAGAAAVDRNRARVLGAVEHAAVAVAELGLHSRLQLQKLVGVTAVERQLVDRAVVDDRTQLRAGGVDLRRLGGHFDNLLGAARLHAGVQRQHLVHVHLKAFLEHVLLEALKLKLDTVDSGNNFHEIVVAASIGGHGADVAGRVVGQRDFHSLKNRTRRIGHSSDDSAGGTLSEPGQRGQNHKQSKGGET